MEAGLRTQDWRRVLAMAGLVLMFPIVSRAEKLGEQSNMTPVSARLVQSARDRLRNHPLDRLAACSSLEDSLAVVLGRDYLELARAIPPVAHAAVRCEVLATTMPPFSQVFPENYGADCPPNEEPDLRALRWDAKGSLVTVRVLEIERNAGLDIVPESVLTLPCYLPTTSAFYFEHALQAIYPHADLFAILGPDPLCPSTCILRDVVVLGEPGTPYCIGSIETLGRLYSADPDSLLAGTQRR